MSEIKEHIALIIEPEQENELARRFDYLMYSIELAMLEQKNLQKYWSSSKNARNYQCYKIRYHKLKNKNIF